MKKINFATRVVISDDYKPSQIINNQKRVAVQAIINAPETKVHINREEFRKTEQEKLALKKAKKEYKNHR